MPHYCCRKGLSATTRLLRNSANLVVPLLIVKRLIRTVSPALRQHSHCNRSRRALAGKRAEAAYARAARQNDEIRPGSDPGSWAFSPEWFGTQGGNWGRDEGEIAFEQQSHHGNGLVRVTSHPASKQDPIPLHESAACLAEAEEMRRRQQNDRSQDNASSQEWRVLRFNEDTVQSVARVAVHRNGKRGTELEQRPDCMAFLYMKTIGAAVASIVGLAPEASSLRSALSSNAEPPCRVLCIGLGGGTLPIFLAHHFPGMEIDVVEIDPVVISAAQEAMGFPKQRQRLRIHNEDAISWLESRCASQAPYLDFVFVDAFDGDNNVPEAFQDAGDPFMVDLAESLHPEHGAAIVNLHRGGFPSLWKQLKMKLAGQVWMDPFVTPVARVYKRMLMPRGEGRTYMLGVGKQYNTIVVAARGKHLNRMTDFQHSLTNAASNISQLVRLRFKVDARAILEFREV